MKTLLFLTILYSIFSFVILKLSGVKEKITLSNLSDALLGVEYNEFWVVKKYILLGGCIFLLFVYAVIIAAIVGVLSLIVTYLP